MPSNKKKKPASNPARGFATTSIASKTRESAPPPESPASATDTEKSKSKTGASTSTPASRISAVDKPDESTRELHELSPEELEKRLEETELQHLVEKHGPKSLREANRHVSKLQADVRLSRPQAQPLALRPFVPLDTLHKVLEFATEEVREGRRSHVVEDPPTPSTLPEEDLIWRLWTLQRSLDAFGFSLQTVRLALSYVLLHPPPLEHSTSLIWGLEECIDWLVLNSEEDTLPLIETSTGKPAVLKDEALEADVDDQNEEVKATLKVQSTTTSTDNAENNSDSADATHDDTDTDVSDVASDLEPDEMLSVYLRTKARLFDKRPDLADPSKSGRSKKNRQPNNSRSGPSAESKSVRKIQHKLQKIESDPIFDKDDANFKWEGQRIVLQREAAERKRLNLNGAPKPTVKSKEATSESQPQSTAPTSQNSDDEDDVLGAMFGDMVKDVPMPDEDEAVMPEPINVLIRDFGETTGMSPRKLLEETCKTRDPSVKFKYHALTQVSFSNRQSLTISWSKPQPNLDVFDISRLKITATSKKLVVEMQEIACPSQTQSEYFVCTASLFLLLSASSKDEKGFLKLPPSWRDLYREFLDLRKAKNDADDRETVRELREMIRSRNASIDDAAEDDVIHANEFRKRNANGRNGHASLTVDANLEMIKTQLQDFWAARTASSEYQRMLPIRQSLPMAQFKDVCTDTVSRNQITILCGETGCGKSTQMPAYILDHELSAGRNCKIYCTEPRRISAITLAQRVAEELGESKAEIGSAHSLVGYAIRLESKTSSNTRLVYATTGIVLRMLESADGFAEVTHLIIDEVHERSIETDFLLIILRKLVVSRPNLKVVLMSATVDAERFSQYFSGAPILTVPGRTFPVETLYLEDAIERTGYVLDKDDHDASEDNEVDPELEELAQTKITALTGLDASQYSAKTRTQLGKYNEYNVDYNLIARLIEVIAFDQRYFEYNRAILVFLPGLQEIRRMNDTLSGSKISQRYVVHQLHSTISSEDQQAAFMVPPRGTGKIVLSTNIAETGVTIPDVTCVIDTGKHKEMRFDERRQVSRLVESFISRANAKQRRGRAGRVQQGICFHLFTKHRHDVIMAPQQTPEMLRLSLQDLIMRVKICKLGDIQDTLASALDPPLAKNIRRAIDALIEVEALTPAEELTQLGQQLSKLPLDPYLGKLVLFGAIFNTLDMALTVAAILTSKSPFVSPIGAGRDAADKARAAFRKSDSDVLTEYNAYNAWRRVCSQSSASHSSEQQFCRRNCLSSQTLASIEDLKAQLLGAVADSGFISLNQAERRDVSRISNSAWRSKRRFASVPGAADEINETLSTAVLSWAFYPKLLVRDGKGWKNVATGTSIVMHPTSVLRGLPAQSLNKIQFLSYYSVIQSSHGAKNYNASSVTPAAALPLLLGVGGAVHFHPLALVASVDGPRIRFLLNETSLVSGGGWKAFVALKFLRRRLDECLKASWKRPSSQPYWRLQRWWDIWKEIADSWVDDAK